MIGPQWLESILEVQGLDPLGVHAISINIYGYLLPGMTNVTIRLRYYTFLCWLLYNYLETSQSKSIEEWQTYVRRSEFLFALISDFHHLHEKDYNSSTVGSRTSRAILKKEEEDPVDITKYTKFESSPERYFQNRGGGFAQYYHGPMRDLKLIVDGGPLRVQLADDVKETNEVRFGLKAAKAFSKNKNLDLFNNCVKKGKATKDQLKILGDTLCACEICENPEEECLLTNLMFDFENYFSESGERRRKTLTLILNLIRDFGQSGISIEDFRNICLYKYYPNGKKIMIPDDLKETLEFWSIYQTHEYFAYALLCFLNVFERIIRKDYFSFNDLIEFIRKDLLKLNLNNFPYLKHLSEVDFDENANLDIFIKSIAFLNEDESRWLQENLSEFYFSKQIDEHLKDEYLAPLVYMVFILLVKIYLKTSNKENFYKNLKVFLTSNYGIHINFLNRVIKENLKKENKLWILIKRVFKEFVIGRHTLVAYRKLRYEKKSTLRYVLENNKYFPTKTLKFDTPVFSSPRLAPAFRFLEDLRIINKNIEDKYILTQKGYKILEKLNEL